MNTLSVPHTNPYTRFVTPAPAISTPAEKESSAGRAIRTAAWIGWGAIGGILLLSFPRYIRSRKEFGKLFNEFKQEFGEAAAERAKKLLANRSYDGKVKDIKVLCTKINRTMQKLESSASDGISHTKQNVAERITGNMLDQLRKDSSRYNDLNADIATLLDETDMFAGVGKIVNSVA